MMLSWITDPVPLSQYIPPPSLSVTQKLEITFLSTRGLPPRKIAEFPVREIVLPRTTFVAPDTYMP